MFIERPGQNPGLLLCKRRNNRLFDGT